MLTAELLTEPCLHSDLDPGRRKSGFHPGVVNGRLFMGCSDPSWLIRMPRGRNALGGDGLEAGGRSGFHSTQAPPWWLGDVQP